MKIKVEQANYNGVECDMEVFDELYHGEEDNDYLELIAFLSSLDEKAREQVIDAIKLYHYIVDDYEDESEEDLDDDEWN